MSPKGMEPLAAPASVLKDYLDNNGATADLNSSATNTRLNTMMKNFERHQNEKWKKALKHLGINENLFPNKKDEIETFYPFNEFTIPNVRSGQFLSRQLEKVVIEITNIDVVN